MGKKHQLALDHANWLWGNDNKRINDVIYLNKIDFLRYFGINMPIKKLELQIYANSTSKA